MALAILAGEFSAGELIKIDLNSSAEFTFEH
jgi:hypothetical protein